jgi:hypothetical protein
MNPAYRLATRSDCSETANFSPARSPPDYDAEEEVDAVAEALVDVVHNER